MPTSDSAPAEATEGVKMSPRKAYRPGLRSCPRVAAALAEHGVAVEPGFVPRSLVRRLKRQVLRELDDGAFRAARIGGGRNARYCPEVRSDYIRWLEPSPASSAERELFARLERLRLSLNRQAMLGLFEWEGHLACYPRGSFYRRHLDVFSHARERQVTTVLYLNEEWRPGDGGELRLFLERDSIERFVDVPPLGGTLVTFLSEQTFHAVQPAIAPRLSVTGWFRTRGA